MKMRKKDIEQEYFNDRRKIMEAYELAISPAKEAYNLAIKPADEALYVANQIAMAAEEAYDLAREPIANVYNMAIEPAMAARDKALREAKFSREMKEQAYRLAAKAAKAAKAAREVKP